MKSSLLYISLLLLSYGVSAQVNVGEKGQIPLELKENSGYIFYDGTLISHNDSGNEPILYVLDTVSMEITRRVTISNAVNIDWEDISQDDLYIYAADIGNYSGTRTDLAIYKILKTDFDREEEVTAEIINFQYEDQEVFSDNGKSNWDAEALAVIDDQLWIFTKQWIDEGTVAYSLPKAAGSHTASRVANYVVNGLVSGATYNALSNDLLLLAYTNALVPFILRFEDFNVSTLFGNTAERIPLEIGFGQAEAITSITADRYFIGTEQFQRTTPAIQLDPMLYSVQFIENATPDEEIPDGEETPEDEPKQDRLLLYGTFDSKILQYELSSEKSVLAQAVFDTSGKMVRFKVGTAIESNDLDVATFKAGVYYLTLYLGDETLSKAFVAY